jgi:plastocyanin
VTGTGRIFGALGAHNLRRVLAAALLGALALALLASGRPVSDAHAATSCTKHTKRVVKHVKRHGKRKRVVRFTHYWTCQEVATPPVTTAPAAPAPSPAPETPAPQPEPEPNAVSIATNDHTDPYEYVPSRKIAKAGRLTVQLNNKASEDEHNMDMQRVGESGELEGPVIAAVSAAGGSPSEAVAVEVQPGTYEMWCTIGHHAEHGMRTTITVE